jgi:hypothetical protein
MTWPRSHRPTITADEAARSAHVRRSGRTKAKYRSARSSTLSEKYEPIDFFADSGALVDRVAGVPRGHPFSKIIV